MLSETGRKMGILSEYRVYDEFYNEKHRIQNFYS